MKKVKILMLGTSINTKGGISSLVNQYLASDLKKNFKIKYIETHCDGSKFAKFFIFIKAYFQFLWQILYFNPQIVHIHSASRASFYRKSLFVLTSKLFFRKTVFHLHGAQFMIFYQNESGWFKKQLIKIILLLNDIVIVLSKKWEADIKSISSRIKTKVIFNSVAVPNIKEKNQNEIPEIIFMGRVGKRKGFHDLIEAVKILIKRKKKFKCIVCGDGDIDFWKTKCKEAGLEEIFIFKGWIKGKEKDSILRRADIFVLPSYNEGVSMALLEAMAYGLPVVASKVGGIPEVVRHNFNGYLIEPGDTESLANYLEVLLNNSFLRKEMGANSRKIVLDNFNINIAIDKLKNLYLSLI